MNTAICITRQLSCLCTTCGISKGNSYALIHRTLTGLLEQSNVIANVFNIGHLQRQVCPAFYSPPVLYASNTNFSSLTRVEKISKLNVMAILSCGIERVLTDSAQFAKEDLEYFAFTIRTLKGE